MRRLPGRKEAIREFDPGINGQKDKAGLGQRDDMYRKESVPFFQFPHIISAVIP